jgi:hypothetical protein
MKLNGKWQKKKMIINYQALASQENEKSFGQRRSIYLINIMFKYLDIVTISNAIHLLNQLIKL